MAAEESGQWYKIGEAAKHLDIAVETIRMYEREGLIVAQRKGKGHRIYNEADLNWLGCIRKLIKEQHLNIEGIRRLLALIPCWELKPCSIADKTVCPAYQGIRMPCWSMKSRLPVICRYDDCRECQVYRRATTCKSLMPLLYEVKHSHELKNLA